MLLAVPAAAAVPGPSASPSVARAAGADPASDVPQVLSLPFAERAGFDVSMVAGVTSPAPSNDASVLVAITLMPQDAAFFAPTTTPLTAQEVRDRFAPPASDEAGLVSYLEAHGLTLVHEWPDGLSLTVEGSAAAVGAAFGTRLDDGLWQGQAVRFPSSSPSLPAPFESEVAAVSGLSSGFSTFTLPFVGRPAPTATPVRTTNVVTPSAVHTIYGLDGLYNYSGSPHWATGVGIALVLWGEGYAPSDLATFFSTYYPGGFPSVTVRYLPVDGAPAPSESAVYDPSNVTSEMTLDLEWAGSAAPGATLTAVYAPDGPASNHYSPSDASLEDAINAAVQSTGAKVVSMSFGTPDGSDLSFQSAVSISLAEAQQLGITVIAASGDTGGALRPDCTGGPSPEFPASSPLVIATGGTAPVLGLDAFGGVTGLVSEPAWNRSGGGFSTVYPAPSWQHLGASSRGIPDVAGPAADNIFYYRGAETAGAGTSFAAPFWAGIVAEMDAIRGSALGFISPRLYAVGSADVGRPGTVGLVDISSGGNCLGPATTGWDSATGWGTPRGLALYEELSGTFVNVSLALSEANVPPGGSFLATVSVSNATTGAPVWPVNVSYELAGTGYGGPCTGSFQVVAVSTDSTGRANTTLTVPACFLGASVTVTATVSGGGYFGSASGTVGVNLIGVAGFLAIVQVYPYNLVAFGVIMAVASVVGWRLGAWRSRSARRRTPPTGTTPAMPPPGSGEARAPVAPRPAPSGGAGPLGGPPGTASAAVTAPAGATAPVTPVVVPSHVVSPPPSPPPLPAELSAAAGASAATTPGDAPSTTDTQAPDAPARTCPTCGASVPAFDAACPVCRTAVS